MFGHTLSTTKSSSLTSARALTMLARFMGAAAIALAGLLVPTAAVSSPVFADGSVRVGAQARVTAGLNVRSCPSTGCSIVGGLSAGDIVTIDGGPTAANGYRWWHHSRGGWSIDNNLTYYQAPQPQPKPQPQPQPGPHPQAQSSGGPSDYTRCAGENQRCSFSGTADVVYGANGHFTGARQFTGGTDCNNNVFSDPVRGVVKACYFRTVSQAQPAQPEPQSSGAPSGYTRCAGENQRCSFSGTADVVYGANGHFTGARQFTGGADCNNNVFSDPVRGVVKACYLRATSTSPSQAISLSWPADPSTVTQWFGARPAYYAQFGLNGHEGIDFGIPNGTPVRAAADGTAQWLTGNPFYGCYVVITHSFGSTTYAHLTSVGKIGSVKAGDTVGYSGGRSTDTCRGNSQGEHLHFGLKVNGMSGSGYAGYVDPRPFLR